MKEKGGEVCINRFSVNPSSLTHCDAVGGAGPAPRQTPVPTCVPLKGGKDPRQRVGGSVKAKRPIPIHPQKLPAGLPYEFQSTPPYGGDDSVPRSSRADWDFNPRPHTGATSRLFLSVVVVIISIHAPIRGRLLKAPFTKSDVGISIHAPIRGRQKRDRGKS